MKQGGGALAWFLGRLVVAVFQLLFILLKWTILAVLVVLGIPVLLLLMFLGKDFD